MVHEGETHRASGGVLVTGLSARKFTASTLAMALVVGSSVPAWSNIENTVTASGFSPGSLTADVTATADETVDVEDAAPDVIVTKTADVTVNVPIGDTITYTYTVENNGNITLTEVSLLESHEGTGPAPVPTLVSLTNTSGDSSDDSADNDIDVLAPGDLATWSATYDVTQDDVINQLDNDLDNTVTALATPAAGTIPPASLSATEEVDLEDQDPSLSVTKVADLTLNVPAGQTVTYTYVVTNDGNVPITEVTLSDNVTAGSGGNPTPTLVSITNTSGNSVDDTADNDVDLLYPGDSATYTGTYVVTQDDVDNLQ